MIPLFKVFMNDEAGEEVAKTLKSGYISEGPKVSEFENALSEYFECEHVAAVNSCTSGLTLALATLDIGSGDEVITTPMSCAATNMPISAKGADIVWADIDPHTGNISADSIAERITDKTKAVLYVHWAGQPADIESINEICRDKGIAVIEDAAHAIGSTYDGKKIGTHGDFVCFSFQAIKHLTTGDGGMVAINGPHAQERWEKLCRIRWFGLTRSFGRTATKWDTDIREVGYKMHMNDINATIGLANLKHLGWIVERHAANALEYDHRLSGLKGIRTIPRDERSVNAAWLYTLLLDGPEQREHFVQHMAEHGVASNVVHVRNDEYEVFSKYRRDLPGVDDFCSRMINIPCGWWIEPKDVDHIVEAIQSFSKGIA